MGDTYERSYLVLHDVVLVRERESREEWGREMELDVRVYMARDTRRCERSDMIIVSGVGRSCVAENSQHALEDGDSQESTDLDGEDESERRLVERRLGRGSVLDVLPDSLPPVITMASGQASVCSPSSSLVSPKSAQCAPQSLSVRTARSQSTLVSRPIFSLRTVCPCVPRHAQINIQ